MKTDTYKKFLQSSRFFNCFLSSPLGLAGGDNAVAYIRSQKSQLSKMISGAASTVRSRQKEKN